MVVPTDNPESPPTATPAAVNGVDLRELLANLPHPAALWDRAGGLLDVNDVWAQTLGEEAAFEPGPLQQFRRRHAAEGAAAGVLPLRGGGAVTVHSSRIRRGESQGEGEGGADDGTWLLLALPVAGVTAVANGSATPPAGVALLVDLLPIAAAVAIDPHGRHVRVNAAMRDLFDLPGHPGDAAEAEGVPDDLLRPLRRAAAGEEASDDGEILDVPRQNGTRLHVRAWAVPLRDGAGEVSGAIAFYAEDGADGGHAAVSAELQESRDALRRALHDARVASGTKDRFLAMISHELRTPLTPALVTLTNLIRDLGDRDSPRHELRHELRHDPGGEPRSLRRDLEVVRRGIELEARLIDDLLDLTRLARGRLKLSLRPLGLNAIVAETAELARPEVEAAGLSLEVRLDAARDRVVGDPDRLRQVVWNLLTNATKFNRPGGHIDVATSNLTDPGDPAAGDTIRVDVRDTGIGIDPEELPSLFLAFEQMEHRGINRFGGLGLALTISKGLINLQGGRLFAESEGKGRGSLFGLEFPLTEESSAAADAGGAAANPPPAEPPPLDILLVDDHAETLRAMRLLLGRLGHHVTPAASVAEARAAVEQRDGRDGRPFDLLVSDIGLPDGSGLEIPPLLRSTWPKSRVASIALSGFGMSRDLDASRDAGFDVHLVKPVSLDQLQGVIARVAAPDPPPRHGES